MKTPYYFYIFKLIDVTGEYFGSKYYLKLGFTRDAAKRLTEWRRDLKKMLKSNNIPENAILIDVDYYTIPGVFENGNGEYILIGRDSKNIEHFDQDVRNCLYEFELTKRQNYDIKPLEKKGIKDVFSIEGLDLYDDISYEDVISFFEKDFIPNVQKKNKEFQKYYFTLTEKEYIQFCKDEVSKIDKDISKLNVKQFRDYIEKKYGVSLDMKFLTILNIDNNPYDDILSILVYMGSYLIEDTCKLLMREYNKVNDNYQVKKDICKWLCIYKDKKMKKSRCFKNSIFKGGISHAPICGNTYKKMMSVYYRYNDVYKCDIKYVFTHNHELCDSLIKDFGEDVKIYILPLTEIESAHAMHYRDCHKYKQNIFVIFNKEMKSDLYCENADFCLKIIKRKIKDMNIKFSEAFYISNPPFNGNNRQQIYPKFYKFAIRNFKQVLMIFPSTWEGNNIGSGLSEMTDDIKRDNQIVCIDNVENAFPGVDGAKDTCIIYWKRGYNNGLNGKQRVYDNGENCKIKNLCDDKHKLNKPQYLQELVDLVKYNSNYKFVGMNIITSVMKPYGFRTDFLKSGSFEKYNFPKIDISKVIYLKDIHNIKKDVEKINLYGMSDNGKCCVELDDSYPIKTTTDNKNKYKIFISKSWGNWSNIYGGSYADIIIGRPLDICTEKFIESGSFDTLYEAQCHSKYIMSKFARYLLLHNKNGAPNSRNIWSSVPIQDYSEDWWSTDDIDEIDKCLFEKYSVPDYIIKDIENVQRRSVENIFNYGIVDKSSISENKENKSKSKYNEEINEPLWD